MRKFNFFFFFLSSSICERGQQNPDFSAMVRHHTLMMPKLSQTSVELRWRDVEMICSKAFVFLNS